MSLTGTGVTPVVIVHPPKLYRRTDPSGAGGGSHEFATVTLYNVSEPNGLVLYAQSNPIAGYYAWNNLAAPVVDAFHPPLYTDGSATLELANFCPNASRDVEVVGDRAWLIDAERTNRAWPSKPIVPGFAPEFNPDLSR